MGSAMAHYSSCVGIMIQAGYRCKGAGADPETEHLAPGKFGEMGL
jgi:hypothetical protein